MRKLVLIALCCLLASSAQAARGFGTTYGAGAADVVQTGYTTALGTTQSVCAWLWVHGTGGNAGGRIHVQNTSGGLSANTWFINGGVTAFLIGADFTTTDGNFTYSFSGTDHWHQHCYTYDASSTSNKPTVYVDGATVSVTITVAPVGTYTNTATNICVGNRCGAQTSNRNFDGKIAEYAVWNNTILTANQIKGMGQGASPLQIGSTPSYYDPMYGQTAGDPDWGPSRLAQTITGTLAQPHAPLQPYPQIHYGQ